MKFKDLYRLSRNEMRVYNDLLGQLIDAYREAMYAQQKVESIRERLKEASNLLEKAGVELDTVPTYKQFVKKETGV